MIVADTSALYAALVQSEGAHLAARAFMEQTTERFVLSPFVLAELDCLLRSRVDESAPLALLDDVIAGAYELAGFDESDLVAARDLLDRYQGLGLSLADASLVVLAERHETSTILTLDERHFRAVTRADGGSFVLVPADA